MRPHHVRTSTAPWERVQQLFIEAVELPGSERVPFLASCCPTDAGLRAEVLALLEGHDALLAGVRGSDGFLELLDPVRAAELVEGEGDERAEGAMIGPYRVVREVARGGMAVVLLASDTRLDRAVALKLLPPYLSGDAAAKQRFIQEARAASALDHPSIGTLHEIGETDDGRLYMVMPFYAGETVRDLVERGPVPVARALSIAEQVAAGLAAAHGKGIVHRDIKPSNIVVTETGLAKVLDFGIAKVAGGIATRDGAVLGTIAYMSPEQTRGEAVDARTDVWSLGVVLHEMLRGERPFRGETDDVLIHAIRHDRAPSLLSSRPDVSSVLASIVDRCLAKDPQARYRSASEVAAALRGASAGRQPSAALRRIAGAILVASLAGAGVLAVRQVAQEPTDVSSRAGAATPTRNVTGVAASAAVLAVLPFQPAAPDSALARLGRDLVVALSASLDGVGEIRTVDALTTLTRTANEPAGATLEQDVEIARSLGATGVVRGGITRQAGGVRLDVILHATADGAAVARASATAAAADLGALTDSLAWTLLRGVWRSGTPPTPSLAAVTTRSLPALRAFLEGERLVAEDRWGGAADAFARAIAADSTFWFAYWRYAWARGYGEDFLDARAVETYHAHRFEFPERDRLMIEARTTDSMSVRLRKAAAIVDRFPGYWPAWFDYGDRLVHHGPYVGTRRADARVAMERVVALNPNMTSAWQHLFWLAAAELDTAASGRALRHLARLRYDSVSLDLTRLNELVFYRYIDRLMRSGGAVDATLGDSMVQMLATSHTPQAPESFGSGISWFGFHRASVDLARRMERLAAPADIAAAFRRGVSLAWAGRGAWDSALVAVERYATGAPDVAAALYAYRVAVVGHWLRAVASDRLERLRAVVGSKAHELPPHGRAELAWLDGVAAFAGRDRNALARARHRLDGADTLTAPLLDRSLAALELELRGARREAAEMLVALERERAESRRVLGLGEAHPFLTAVNRVAASELLLALGDTAQASHLLTWHESSMLFPLWLSNHAKFTMDGITYLMRARIEEATGRSALARSFYLQFLRRYDMPVAAHQPLVDEARAALVRLGGTDPGETGG